MSDIHVFTIEFGDRLPSFCVRWYHHQALGIIKRWVSSSSSISSTSCSLSTYILSRISISSCSLSKSSLTLSTVLGIFQILLYKRFYVQPFSCFIILRNFINEATLLSLLHILFVLILWNKSNKFRFYRYIHYTSYTYQ